MPPTGYPDYQRVTFDAGNLFYSANKPITASGYQNGTTPCSNWESISVYCQAPAGSDYYLVNCVFFADPNGVTVVAQPQFVVGPNFRAIKSVPVEGPYFALYVFTLAGNNNTSVNLAAYGGAANVSSLTWDFLNDTVYNGIFTLAAGASNLDNGANAAHGPATVAFDTSSTKNFRCAILYFRWGTGKFENLYLFYGADIGRGAIITVDLPLTPLQFYIQNTDAAAQTVMMRVVPRAVGFA